ncbi:MAG: LacI family DNA-binding transcriptional regulator [Methylobacterium sp.]|nr:LacI family DNA-binding transcriptional regulator [Cupriavidus sp.]MCA3656962.1 LacI family DNA-binding transcriptional regulator [Methylobacterium sp.]MCA3678280.1 LacI family DNA-binding transcriptional regulator [Methylobacterium sp.]MCA3679328.1 LacI family DNA-binding transcriptional regulator [Methylobacterium sp.]MCA3684705.1 LacI family DNA-binding transcriptional regulator [Methylobacterium sp.]
MANIKDVADLARCSIATVSRYVNGAAPISVEARARIEAAIFQTGYRPSEIGRSLKRQATRTLGIVVPSLTNPVFALSVSGFQLAARLAGYHVLIATSDYDPAIEAAAVETFLGQSVDGLALTVCDSFSSPALATIDAAGKPNVLLFNPADQPDRLAVTVDNIAAARAMTETILSRGHRRVAFLAGQFAASDRSRLRYRGYAAALAQAGLKPPLPLELDFLDTTPDAALLPLLSDDNRPTALFCSNDVLALGVIGALKRFGARVPDDMSVVGFDGIDLGQMVEPTLCTVAQPARAMGERACEQLLNAIRNTPVDDPGAEHFLDFEIHHGGSLGPAPLIVGPIRPVKQLHPYNNKQETA